MVGPGSRREGCPSLSPSRPGRWQRAASSQWNAGRRSGGFRPGCSTGGVQMNPGSGGVLRILSLAESSASVLVIARTSGAAFRRMPGTFAQPLCPPSSSRRTGSWSGRTRSERRRKRGVPGTRAPATGRRAASRSGALLQRRVRVLLRRRQAASPVPGAARLMNRSAVQINPVKLRRLLLLAQCLPCAPLASPRRSGGLLVGQGIEQKQGD